MIIKESRKLNEFNDNTNGAELFRACMNIITDNYGNKFNTSLQNVTENVMSEFEEYINDEASNFVVDEIYAGGELDKEKYLDEFDNFITFNLRENDINEYDFNESMDVNEARQMHTWSITYNGKGNKAKTHMVDAPDAYEANRKARRELGISYTDIDDVTMVENKDNLKEAVDDDKVFVVSYIDAEVYVDDYEQGEGKYVNGFSLNLNGQFTSIQQLISAIANEYWICTDEIEGWEFSANQSALQTSSLVNANNELADEAEMDAWKNGELELYVCHLYVPIRVISKPRAVTREEAEAEGLEVWD